MELLKISGDTTILIQNQISNQINLDWSESFKDYEEQLLERLINDPNNYETVRYIHSPYSGITTDNNLKQTDIWFYFYFISGTNYVQNYEAIGLSSKDNSLLTKQTTNSFFRLEFYKTLNNESPDRSNRKLVFAKNLTIPSGEKFFLTKDNLNELIYVPVFNGSSYRNKENMYMYWFQDDTPLDTTLYTGNTFWFTAKYFDAITGDIIDFLNKCHSNTYQIQENKDMYYQMVIDRSDFSYKIYSYNGTTGSRVGFKNLPIKFYEKGGASC